MAVIMMERLLGKDVEFCPLEARVMVDQCTDQGQGHSLEVGQDLAVALEVGLAAGQEVQVVRGQGPPVDQDLDHQVQRNLCQGQGHVPEAGQGQVVQQVHQGQGLQVQQDQAVQGRGQEVQLAHRGQGQAVLLCHQDQGHQQDLVVKETEHLK